jgi:hypothetical protein
VLDVLVQNLEPVLGSQRGYRSRSISSRFASRSSLISPPIPAITDCPDVKASVPWIPRRRDDATSMLNASRR